MKRHVMIYAPPGYGKLTLQKKMFKRNLLFLDTDDMPAPTKADITNILKHNSVLTNRWELIDKNIPTIIFKPMDSGTFINRVIEKCKIDEHTAQEWFNDLQSLKAPDNLTCLTRSSYIGDWF